MKNLIGNEWVDASDGSTVDVVNPATNEVIASVPNATKEDVDKLIYALNKTYEMFKKYIKK